jgi:hypothetical protein
LTSCSSNPDLPTQIEVDTAVPAGIVGCLAERTV